MIQDTIHTRVASIVPNQQTRHLAVFMFAGWLLSALIQFPLSSYRPEEYESWGITMQLVWHLDSLISGITLWVLFVTPLVFLLVLRGKLRTRVYGTFIGSSLIIVFYGLLEGALDSAVHGVKNPFVYEDSGGSYWQYVLDGAVSTAKTNLEFLIFSTLFLIPFVVLLYVSPVDPTEVES